MGPSRAVTRRAAGKNAGFHPRSARSGGGCTGPALRRPRDRVAHSLCALTRRGDPAVTWRQLGIARNFRGMNSYRATFSARESGRISGRVAAGRGERVSRRRRPSRRLQSQTFPARRAITPGENYSPSDRHRRNTNIRGGGRAQI